MWQGPASMTVTGTWRPSWSKICVIPTFLPKSPIISLFLLQLDFNVHAGREVQFHQSIHGAGSRLLDRDQPLVRADLELVAGLLINVRAAENGGFPDMGRKRNRADHLRARALGRAHDFLNRL